MVNKVLIGDQRNIESDSDWVGPQRLFLGGRFDRVILFRLPFAEKLWRPCHVLKSPRCINSLRSRHCGQSPHGRVGLATCKDGDIEIQMENGPIHQNWSISR
jgi:hypothetical protein